jgi:hypothetical protein
MRYSLVVVTAEKETSIDGVWIQNHTGTIETASQCARETEKANSNSISVAVVEDLNYSCPNYSLRRGLVRLDL